jgi:alkanesulfonate monooxygenase SsuD/methylene tetrahydromethanopterin reductase-like flavin-dependent oxidoreductase (luciferase family)
MKLDLFYEFCQGRPYMTQVGADRELFEEVLEQAVVADEVGFNCFWSVEHHGTVEVTHMPAPESFLTAVAMKTKQLRVGHSVRLAPYGFNHPIRLAEQAAVLDNLSGGRLNVGFGRSVPREWVNFEVQGDETAGQLEETMRVVPRLWTEPHVTYRSDTLLIPRFTLVPRVLQQPHPPMYMACTSPDSFVRAAQWGVGAIGLTLARPVSYLEERIALYKDGIGNAEPVGNYVNNSCGAFTFVYCAETEEDAIHGGAPAAAAWYISKVAAHYSSVPRKRGDGGEDFEKAFLFSPEARVEALRALGDTPAVRCMIKLSLQEHVSDEEFYEAFVPEDQVIIGTPDQVVQKLKRYEGIGLDHLMCMVQGGPSLPHDKIIASLRRMGEHVIPVFHGETSATKAREQV